MTKEDYKHWYLANRERQLVKMKLWAKKNPESNKQSAKLYRAKYIQSVEP